MAELFCFSIHHFIKQPTTSTWTFPKFDWVATTKKEKFSKFVWNRYWMYLVQMRVLWQPLDQCPIAVLQVNLKDGYLVEIWVIYSQENLIRSHNSILPTIYMKVHGPCYNYTCSTLMFMFCPHCQVHKW